MKTVDVQDKRISVLGGAKSGLAAARLLAHHGASVFLSDRASAESMRAAADELTKLGLAFEFGTNSPQVLDADMIVISPGVPSHAPIVRDAVAKNIPIVSELEVGSWFCRAPIVAITGTNGKTTTTTLTGRMFSDARSPSAVAGNIGTAFCDVAESVEAGGTMVLEVSSFQLDHVRDFAPRVSVLLNLTPDHLDRYEHSAKKYYDAKCRIFEKQSEGDFLIYNHDDAEVRDRVRTLAPRGVRAVAFALRRDFEEGAFVDNGKMVVALDGVETEIIPTDDISIRGTHNLYDAMAATLASRVRGIPAASLRATLRNFKGVEHRLEFVRDINGVSYINDSKATNVDSVWYALQSYDRPLIVMLGGRDKGNDYAALVDLVRSRVKRIIAIGESAEKVENAFKAYVPVVRAGSMDEAVRTGARFASAGDIVLLSPACASFDWFENYEHRGKVFKECVMKLAEEIR